MTKFIITALALSMGVCVAFAQTEDSVPAQELKELVVNARYDSADAKGLKFTPSGKQKSSALNGIDLLRRMAIPQLKIGLSNDNVTTQSGELVAIFINYIPASSQELEGLRTTDVRRVEYFFLPSDQRFLGERNVVNIIVQAYEYGGYTKVSLYEKFLLGLSNKASVYSRFSYRKMTYDVYVGSANINNHHQGTTSTENFRIPQPDGSTLSIQRDQILHGSKYAFNFWPISFRAAYSNMNFQVKNTVGFIFQETPHNVTDGSLKLLPSNSEGYDYTNSSDSRVRSLSYDGSFNFNFPNQYALSLSPQLAYSHTNQSSIYKTPLLTASIVNNAAETSYNAFIMAIGRKIFSDVHYIFIRGFGGYNHYKVNYSGNTIAFDKIIERYAGMSAQYGYYTGNITADLLLGIRSEHNSVDNENTNTLYPFVNANFGWSPNQNNYLNISFSYSKEPMDANLKSPNIIRRNELMYYSGNPLLKNSPNIMANMSYSWIPAAWLQIAPYIQHYSCFDREIPVYEPYADAKSIKRSYENNGDHHRTQFGLTVSAYLLDRKLQIQLAPAQMIYRSTGYYDLSYTPFILSGAITYYLHDFYFSGYYELRNRTLWTNSGTFYKDKSQFLIMAGWSKSDLNIRLGISNLFRKSWIASTTIFDTPVYSQSSIQFGTSAHCNISISATYTFAYGKKLSKNNEVGEQTGGTSAILK